MEQLVQANSLPYMQGGFSAVTPEGDRVFSLDLLNRGVGPAHQQSLRVKMNDRYVRSVRELLVATFGPEQAVVAEAVLRPAKNTVRTRFIPGGDQQLVFRMVRMPENAQYWDALEAPPTKWDIEYCYCSVFDECWQVMGVLEEPVPIEQCRRDDAHEFMP